MSPADEARSEARRALAAGDCASALGAVDAIAADDRGPDDDALEAAVWMLAGSPRQVARLAATLTGDARAEAEAFLVDPGARDEPPAGAYAALEALASELAAKGRVRALARLNLALADRAPRPDWRWVHVDRAAALARVLGDARLDALVLAHQALRDAEFGEDDDALELAAEALAAGEAAGEERAVALARWAEQVVRARPRPDEDADPFEDNR
ncbi:MAG: hypothetical protein U1F43_09640 [Myxococcota bacterium]